MFSQIARIVKAMSQYRSWLESDPERQQELAFAEKNKEYKTARKELVKSLELSESLQRTLESLKAKSKDTNELETELQNCKNRVEALSILVQELEKELFRLYTKKQVLIARDKANYERLNSDHTNRFALSNPQEQDVGTLMICKERQNRPESKRGGGVGVLFVMALLCLLIYCFSMRI